MGGEVIAAGKDPGREAAISVRLTIIGMAPQPVRDHCDDAGDGEFARLVVELRQRLPEPAAERSVADDRIGDEGQTAPAALGLDDPLGRHIDHPIDETRFGAGGPVMQLVGMQHDDIAGKARAQGAAIVEGLHARKRHADAVGIVPVRRKPSPVKAASMCSSPDSPPSSRSRSWAIGAHDRSRPFSESFAIAAVGAGSPLKPRRELSLMFDTKIVVVLREDLASWQKLNVTAFLTSGIVAQAPAVIGEPYRDAAGNVYNPLSVQPIVVLSADQQTLRTIHGRSLDSGVTSSLYIEEMFATGHDAANRAVFAEFTPETATVVGIALRTDKKIADKITKGARLHA